MLLEQRLAGPQTTTTRPDPSAEAPAGPPTALSGHHGPRAGTANAAPAPTDKEKGVNFRPAQRGQLSSGLDNRIVTLVQALEEARRGASEGASTGDRSLGARRTEGLTDELNELVLDLYEIRSPTDRADILRFGGPLEAKRADPPREFLPWLVETAGE